jgi:hypothetical protein
VWEPTELVARRVVQIKIMIDIPIWFLAWAQLGGISHLMMSDILIKRSLVLVSYTNVCPCNHIFTWPSLAKVQLGFWF